MGRVIEVLFNTNHEIDPLAIVMLVILVVVFNIAMKIYQNKKK